MELPIPLTLSLILLLQTGCGLLGSDPKEPELEPGRRDYVWQNYPKPAIASFHSQMRNYLRHIKALFFGGRFINYLVI